jgi:hypothetical protein
MSEMKKDFAYEIIARNASVGVWVASREGFLISRLKFESVFLFVELHWDAHPRFGTAKPLKELEKCPFRINEWLSVPGVSENGLNGVTTRAILNYLDELRIRSRLLR